MRLRMGFARTESLYIEEVKERGVPQPWSEECLLLELSLLEYIFAPWNAMKKTRSLRVAPESAQLLR